MVLVRDGGAANGKAVLFDVIIGTKETRPHVHAINTNVNAKQAGLHAVMIDFILRLQKSKITILEVTVEVDDVLLLTAKEYFIATCKRRMRSEHEATTTNNQNDESNLLTTLVDASGGAGEETGVRAVVLRIDAAGTGDGDAPE